MPLRLEIKRKLAQRSERVKSVDLHPTEPWILASLYSGTVCIWNYQTQIMVKSFEVTELPVRSAKFIARKQWVVAGADDMFIRVYNYNTMDKVKVYEAHTDYIRCVAVHPTLPYVLSSSDDMLIKLWDWEKSWFCTQIFEGHSHYVMQVTFNPKDTNTFASASLDRTIKIWNLGSPDPNFTLDAHLKGVNCVDYFTGGDRPYLITGSDDHTAKVWDYQTKTCVQTLEGHTHNVSAVCFHPELPIIITGSEDGTVRIWHSTTYRLENTLNYGLERVWAVGYMKGSRRIVIGYDEGTIMVKIGREEPVASMDNSGKIIWAKHNEIQTVNIKSVGADYEVSDGERLPLAVKELGTCDLYPQNLKQNPDGMSFSVVMVNTSLIMIVMVIVVYPCVCITSISYFCYCNGTRSLKHNPNGRFVVVCGDGEYIIYTALAWRNRSFGSALEIVWSSDGEYAVRESTSRIKIFNKSFQEKKSIRPTFSAERIFGGSLLAMCSNDFICFYDWAECRLIRRIDVNVKNLYWADSGDLVTIASDSSFHIIKYNRDVVSAHLDSGRSLDEQGVEESFTPLYDIDERVRTGLWVGDCFIYNNSSWRLNYCVGGEVTTMFHLDRPMYLLGYLANQSRVYLIDKEFNVIGYTLLLTLIEYKTLVMRGDLERASGVLPSIPKEHHNSVAHFLESRGMIEEALEVATDPDYRFELAIHLGKLEIAKDIALVAQSESKWKQLGELAMSTGMLDMAEDCLKHANDLSGLLLLYSSLGDAEEIAKLASLAKENGKNNVAFACLFLLGKLEDCLQLLVDSNRIPEAALMARSYLPSKVSEIVGLWRKDLNKVNQKAAESLADPEEYPNMFEDWQVALEVEAKAASTRGHYPPAVEYVNHIDRSHVNLVEAFRQMQLDVEEPLENGGFDHEGVEHNGKEGEFIDGQEEDQEVGQEGAAAKDNDSSDGAVLVNGHEADEEWSTNDAGTPSA
ncbi:coatomer subunit beta'-2-like isoform X2 [Cynara cardunculus var. scolymus]|uniref:coatomer subunit beta'-2-like isoform X2 n=1 Tax=Cynara cardunculus var. scolymus TaxID=59895 RepID=UPI000D6311FC|nr:coatomer subunit beta'-2-like isoform X2 [Cynara cardunculus var. scolymus]